MLDDKLQLKIELLQDQIDNLEKSGHYTDAEIETQSAPLKHILFITKDLLALIFLTDLELHELKVRIQNVIALKNQNRLKSGGRLNGFKNLASDFISSNKYGMSDQEYEDAKAKHNAIFAPIKTLEIKVIDAEIVSPNHQEA